MIKEDPKHNVTIPCFACGKKDEHLTEFTGSPGFGSKFDFCTAGRLALVLCDGCLERAARGGSVLFFDVRRSDDAERRSAFWRPWLREDEQRTWLWEEEE